MYKNIKIFIYFSLGKKNLSQVSSSSREGAALILGLAPFGKEANFLATACLRRNAAGTKGNNSFCKSRNCGSADIVGGATVVAVGAADTVGAALIVVG
jgi:hypothetical protein